MEVYSVEYFALFLGAPFAIGLLSRRWWLLAAPVVLFVVLVAADAIDGGIEPGRDLGAGATVFFTAVLIVIPVELGLAAGTLIGRRLARPSRHLSA